jgi:hypothetical protein
VSGFFWVLAGQTENRVSISRAGVQGESAMGIAGEGEVLLAFGRYLYWADLMHRNWDKYMTEKADKPAIPEWLGLSCYWGGSLYVVIEGWEAAKFTDPVVDALLGLRNYKDSLRRMRNGTFHYQPELLSPKVAQFFKDPHVTLWLWFLHEEFCRWLREWVDAVEFAGIVLPNESEEWRSHFASVVGWLPLRPAEEELKKGKKMLDEFENKLEAASANHSEKWQIASEIYDKGVKENAEWVRNYRREKLTTLGLNADALVP